MSMKSATFTRKGRKPKLNSAASFSFHYSSPPRKHHVTVMWITFIPAAKQGHLYFFFPQVPNVAMWSDRGRKITYDILFKMME